MKFPIARALLEAELELLLRDHFETMPPDGPSQRDYLRCPECQRAGDIRSELNALPGFEG